MIHSIRLLVLLLLLPAPALAGPPVAAIASAHPLATEAGHKILAQGGNAFDAAVAMAAVLGVVEPANSGLGGGGFWLLHRAADGFETMVDGRERAPFAAHADMYLDKDGTVMPQLSLDGPLAAAIPGTPAALVHIARRYGRLPLAQSLRPAIRLASEGFAVSARYQSMAEQRIKTLGASPAAAIFLDSGRAPKPGYVLRQPELAQTLKRIETNGHNGFYAGETAKRLVEGVRAAGGIWSLRDLQQYKVMERRPLRTRYGNMTITSTPPPSSGGIVLAQMLNMLNPHSLSSMPAVERHEHIIRAMRLAYRERARHLGDPDFVAIIHLQYVAADQVVAVLEQLEAIGRGALVAAQLRVFLQQFFHVAVYVIAIVAGVLVGEGGRCRRSLRRCWRPRAGAGSPGCRC